MVSVHCGRASGAHSLPFERSAFLASGESEMAQRMRWGAFSGSGPELYQRHMVGAIFRPWAGELLALADPRANTRVLDVACGTGAMTRLVAERVGSAGRVLGLDISPACWPWPARRPTRESPGSWAARRPCRSRMGRSTSWSA